MKTENFPAKENDREATVIFVPNFGGSIALMRRHIRLVNELGFNAVAIELSANQPRKLWPKPWPKTETDFGLRHLWQKEISAVIANTPGPKIIFSFSFMSSCALMAIGEIEGQGITAWICEGGPFGSLKKSYENVYTYGFPVESKLKKALLLAVSPVVFGMKNYFQDTEKALQKLPKDLPILSVRGSEDQVVPPAFIDEIFDRQKDLNLKVAMIPGGGHLDGLGKHKRVYIPMVSNFLNNLPSSETHSNEV